MVLLSMGVHGNAAAEGGFDLRRMLLMPGDVIEGHAEFESECEQCHVNFDKANQSPMCLACHDDIAADVEQGHRFHGRLGTDGPVDCGRCHTEHKGRDADIVGLDRDHFPHDRTDLPLLGAHVPLRCESCHEPGTKFRDAEPGCASCHTDVHDGQLGDDCKSCHAETDWQARVFDHDSTGFSLTGHHADTACSACHLDQTFEGASSECVSCHLGKDRHLGGFGRRCQTCHVSESWEKIAFDHARRTDFPLLGRHEQVVCEACHRKGLPLDLPTACVDCHRADDVHREANGADCASCHNETGWRTVEFDHKLDTDFPLEGAHRDVACAGCHAKGAAAEAPAEPRTCVDCHGVADPHQEQLGSDCRRCHGQTSWHQDLVFSEFPLTGAHHPLPCESCHFSSAFHQTLKTCGACHQGDDAHQGAFGESCETCHNTAAWISWTFDHDQATEYPLEGAHQQLACGLCHEPDLTDPAHPSTGCVDCHAGDDIHRGGFGPDCQQCHGTEAFDQER